MDFLSGMAIGAWLTSGAVYLGWWLQRHKTRRLAVARAREMAAAIKEMFPPSEPCPCSTCAEQRRAAAQRGVN